eukprot:gene121-129_t
MKKELRLRIRYSSASASPRLFMYKTSEEEEQQQQPAATTAAGAVETLSVQGWKVDDFKDYLHDHLLPVDHQSSSSSTTTTATTTKTTEEVDTTAH